VKRPEPTAAIPALELLAMRPWRTQITIRGLDTPPGRVELCSGCRRQVVVLDPDEPDPVCGQCQHKRRRQRGAAR
jgi:hypothetical protein